MSDLLRINQLSVNAIVGVHPWEKQQAQQLLFDIEFTLDTSEAARSDDLRHALDYQAVCERLSQRLAASRFELIEALLADVADWLFAQFECKALSITVFKPSAIKQARSVSLTVHRHH